MNKRFKSSIVLVLLLSMLMCNIAFAEDAEDVEDVVVSDENLVLVDEKITISLAGDVSYSTYVKNKVNQFGVTYPMENVREIFQNDDISFINLETAITDRKKPANMKKEYNFASNSNTAKELANSSIDLVNIANNHALDYGQEGFIDTMNLLDAAGVQYVGGGRKIDEAISAKIIEVKNKKIGFIAVNAVVPSRTWLATDKRAGQVSMYPYEVDKRLAYIKEVKSQVDYLILSIHWQGLSNSKNEKDYINAAHKLIDAGVDVVVGTHPHLMQATEYYKDGIIFYSLGNFIFPNMGGRADKAAIIQLEIDPSADEEIKVKYIPTKMLGNRPVLLKDQERLNELYYMNAVNKKFNSYVQANGYMIKLEK